MVNAMRGLLKLYRDTMSKIEDITSRCMTSVCVCVCITLCCTPQSPPYTKRYIPAVECPDKASGMLLSCLKRIYFSVLSQSDLEGAESEIISLRERERQLRIKNKSLATKLRVECEEGKKLRLCMQSKTHQYCHDLKRKDREYERLKDRLGQVG